MTMRVRFWGTRGSIGVSLTAADIRDKLAQARSSRIVVSAAQPVVAEILQISRFNLVLPVFGTTREALASVSPQAVEAFDRG